MFKEPSIISYKRGSSLRDILVKAKLQLISLTLHVEEQLHSCDTFAGSMNGLSLFNYHDDIFRQSPFLLRGKFSRPRPRLPEHMYILQQYVQQYSSLHHLLQGNTNQSMQKPTNASQSENGIFAWPKNRKIDM